MERPDAAAVRAWSRLDFASLGYPAPTPPAADPLEQSVAEADAYVELVTGRTPLETAVPDQLAPLAQAAVRMRTEQVVLGLQAAAVEDTYEALADAGIQSFSVPGYSETRFQPKVEEVYKRLNAWPALAELLLLLMTPEAREAYDALLLGYHAPAFAVTEVDWSDRLPYTPLDPFAPLGSPGGDPIDLDAYPDPRLY